MENTIREAAAWVNERRGTGWREQHLENALAAELRTHGLVVVQQPTVHATLVLSSGLEIQVGTLRPDLLVRTPADFSGPVDLEQCYVELKTVAQGRGTSVSRAHMDQAQGYATQTGVPCVAVIFYADRTVTTYTAESVDVQMADGF
jgi:hypothetical protein